jgi:Do/DeqQ family serine protease
MNSNFKITAIGTASGFAGAALFYAFTQLLQVDSEQDNLLAYYANNTKNGHETKFTDYQTTKQSKENVNFVQAASISTPCVVYIKTVSQGQQSYSWFDMFFNGNGRENRVVGSGSGVIFSKDGYIMTNNHVINNAEKIEVVHNKRTYQAKIIGIDPSTDLALLKVETNNLPSVKLAASTTVDVGDWVLAVGNPFNLNSTVTAGIVSAKGRDIGVLKAQFPLESFIQTDAAINPGNSGGALVNLKGELVGINTAILSQTGSYSGYGFAVPSDIVVKVYNDLKQFGQVQKAFIGADVVDVTEEKYKTLNLNEIIGVQITYIEENGTAENAGLQKNDVILKINGKTIASKGSFEEQLSYYKPGDNITLQISREGKIIEKTLQLKNIDGTNSVIKREVFKAERLGAEFETLHKAEKTRLRLESGVRITKINDNSGLIAQMRLEEGFIITSVNSVKIESPEQLVSILENAKGRVLVQGVNKQGVSGYYSFIF